MRPCVRWVGLELELAVENLDPPLASYFAFLRMAAGEAWDHIRLAALAHAHFRRRAHPPRHLYQVCQLPTKSLYLFVCHRDVISNGGACVWAGGTCWLRPGRPGRPEERGEGGVYSL